jgi:hypothetical protein
MTFVSEHRGRFGVEPILRVLDIPTSTFYGWEAQQRDPCRHRRQDGWPLGKIRAVHARSGGTYGAPRVHAQLRRDGIQTSRKRVARLLGAHGLRGAFLRKRWRCSTRQDPTATPAPDLVNRDFTAPAPNRLWVADLSRIPTGEGPLWLASVRDAYSRRIVGWKTSDRADADLVLGALEYAVWGRGLGDLGDGLVAAAHQRNRVTAELGWVDTYHPEPPSDGLAANSRGVREPGQLQASSACNPSSNSSWRCSHSHTNSFARLIRLITSRSSREHTTGGCHTLDAPGPPPTRPGGTPLAPLEAENLPDPDTRPAP